MNCLEVETKTAKAAFQRCTNENQTQKYTATYKRTTIFKGDFNKVAKQFY